ncbi:unnamed protein product [Absidia cylindrospora]
MADTVQYYMERMLPELEELERKGYFSDVEIKSIIKKRTNQEYAMNRRIGKRIDFLRSIEYEINLEALRKKRKARIVSLDEKKGTTSFSITRRIFLLFKRATNKFRGDLSLWIQYIEFAKRNNAQGVLSAIFVQALQFHPTKPSLWVLAASWEYEENANMSAARLLLQRGLRLNPHHPTLWHEYFRLELLYVEKIKLRRRILGINEDGKATTTTEADMDIDNDDEDDQQQDDSNMIRLPKLTGEDVDNSDSENVDQLKERTTEALKEGTNPILQGLLATIVYKNAIRAHPNDLDFRTTFVDIYRTFSDSEKGCEMVYDSIRQDMNDNAHARAYLATRHLFTKTDTPLEGDDDDKKYISISDPAFVVALKASVDEFNTDVKELCTPLMWQLYVEFLDQWRKVISEENLKLYLTKLLQRTFTACQKQKCLSEALYASWIEYLTDEDQLVNAQVKAKEATKIYSESAPLWIARISLAQREDGDDQPQLALYKIALDRLPSSYDLWAAYDDWLQRQSEENTLDAEEVGDLYMDACQKVTSLLPSVTMATEDRNLIKDLILSSYVRWSGLVGGIQNVRSAYKKVIRNMYPTFEFYKTCLDMENTMGKKDKDGHDSVEFLFEMATRLEDVKEDIYLSHLSYLQSQKKFEKANLVYWKATKEISNKESFDLRYQAITNGKAYNIFSL